MKHRRASAWVLKAVEASRGPESVRARRSPATLDETVADLGDRVRCSEAVRGGR